MAYTPDDYPRFREPTEQDELARCSSCGKLWPPYKLNTWGECPRCEDSEDREANEDT